MFRRKTGKRVAREKYLQAEPGPAPFFSRRVLGRGLTVVGLLAVTVAVLVYGERPLDIREGVRAAYDYVATAPYKYVDYMETERRREQRARAVLNTYEDRAERLGRLQANLLALERAAHDAVPFAQLDPALRGSWDLSERRYAVLAKPECRPLWGAVREVTPTLLAEMQNRGVMSEQRYEAEREENRLQVRVYERSGEAGPATRGLDTVLVLGRPRTGPAGSVEDFLRYKLQKKEAFPIEAYNLLVDLVVRNGVQETLSYHEGRTNQARRAAADAVGEVMRVRPKGEVILPAGRRATWQKIEELRRHRAAQAPAGNPARIRRLAGSLALVAMLLALAGSYTVRYERRLGGSTIRILMLGSLCVLVLLIGKALVLWGGAQLSVFLAPIPCVAVLVAVVYSPRFALVVNALLAVLLGVMAGGDYALFLTMVAAGSTAAFGAQYVGKRIRFLHIGAKAGIAGCLAVWAIGLMGRGEPMILLKDSLWALAAGVVYVGLLAPGVLPAIEHFFGVVTDISLLELTDLSHPLLRKLAIEAHGTYNHSLIVGNLAEAAAQAIGARSLLCRGGAYFHDIGKLAKPDYFVENTGSRSSRHGRLSPAMSTLIILAHVKDGVEMAEEYGLPTRVIDFIREHHGRTLVEYFYREAKLLDGEDRPREESFRYPGPLPQTRETGIVFLADSVEAASRALDDPSVTRIEGLVHEMVMKRLTGGQLDACNLTFRDLTQIKATFARVLAGIYHARVKYPAGGMPESAVPTRQAR